MLARWPSVAANRATSGRGARSTSAGTTARTEARALLLTQVRTQQEPELLDVVTSPSFLHKMPNVRCLRENSSVEAFIPYLPFQVYQPADVQRASQVPPVAVRRARTTARTEAAAQSAWATSRRAAAPRSTKGTAASTVSDMFSAALSPAQFHLVVIRGPVLLPLLSCVRRVLSQQRNLLTNLQRHQTLPVLQPVRRAPVRAGQMSVLRNGQVFHLPFQPGHLQVRARNANGVIAEGILCGLVISNPAFAAVPTVRSSPAAIPA